MAKKKKAAVMEKETEAVGVTPSKTEDDWKTEEDGRTLLRAGEILSCPDRSKKAHGHVSKQKKAMRSVDDLIKHRNTEFGKEE